ncbi:MAG: zinc-binding dehydrogenase, partial [Nitriliruptoraceae bacterium]
PDGWVVVEVQAASLNHHDVWTLRGVGVDPARLPIVLGCDAAGVTAEGVPVVVHAVVSPLDGTDETLSEARTILSEHHDGTFAERVVVPRRNALPLPASLGVEEAACLPVAWLTAYRMLFTRGELRPGQRVLIQGAGGGVSTAALQLAKAAGAHVTVSSRDAARRERARGLGADEAVETGSRLTERVDVVIETVGQATWDHSLKSLRPGGVVVVAGATSGSAPPADLSRVFFRQLRVVGSTMGTREELARLLEFLAVTGVRPLIDDVVPLADARGAFERMIAGDVFGKIVLTT